MSYQPPAVIDKQIEEATKPLRDELALKDEQIKALQVDLMEQVADIGEVQNDIAARSLEITDLQQTVTTKADVVDSRKNTTDIDGVKQTIALMQAHITNLEADVAQLKQGMAKMQASKSV